MSDQNNRVREPWSNLFRLCVRHYWITLFTFLMTGLIFWGSVNFAMDATNKEQFCISCHEMKNNVYQEYQSTIHYSNRTGVRATCPDCHVPKKWIPMMVRKFKAINELYHKASGSINTPEKFENKRLHLAQSVWKTMKENNSQECRNCHGFSFMQLQKQKETSQQAHKRAIKNNRTCIDCHMGIAHELPKDFDKDDKLHSSYLENNRPCADCHKDSTPINNW